MLWFTNAEPVTQSLESGWSPTTLPNMFWHTKHFYGVRNQEEPRHGPTTSTFLAIFPIALRWSKQTNTRKVHIDTMMRG